MPFRRAHRTAASAVPGMLRRPRPQFPAGPGFRKHLSRPSPQLILLSSNDPREPLPDVRHVDHACTPGGASGSTTVTHRPTRGRRPPRLPRRGTQEELGGHEPFLAGEAPTPSPCIHAGQDPLPRALAEAAISTLSSGSCSREQLGRWHLEAQDYFYVAICPRPGLAGSDRPKESRGRWETPGQLRMHGPAPRAVLGRLEMWCEDREETRVP